MFELHQMKDGGTILICQMENNHLINMIKSLCRKIKYCTQILEGNNVLKNSTIFKALKPSLNKELVNQAEENIRYAVNKLQPYVLEACLRNLEISEILQSAFDRNQKIPSIVEFLPELLTPHFENSENFEERNFIQEDNLPDY